MPRIQQKRPGELLLLQWGNIDLTRGELRIRASNAKTRKLRHIPIVARLRAVLKAHGHSPSWVRHGLTPESREAYRTIDLQFRDLRHEAGSRWLEQGLPLHHVKELLGHASISTTDTYLNASRIHRRESMLEMEQRGNSGTNVA